jgi:hypothetical protein
MGPYETPLELEQLKYNTILRTLEYRSKSGDSNLGQAIDNYIYLTLCGDSYTVEDLINQRAVIDDFGV